MKECSREDLQLWYKKPIKNNAEIGTDKIIVLVTNDLSRYFTRWNNNRNENKLQGNNYARLIGFIILHPTSHNAGFYHVDSGCNGNHPSGYGIEGKGYAWDAEEIASFSKDAPCSTLTSFEEIIEYTKQDYKYIIDQTNVRFGYKIR